MAQPIIAILVFTAVLVFAVVSQAEARHHKKKASPTPTPSPSVRLENPRDAPDHASLE